MFTAIRTFPAHANRRIEPTLRGECESRSTPTFRTHEVSPGVQAAIANAEGKASARRRRGRRGCFYLCVRFKNENLAVKSGTSGPKMEIRIEARRASGEWRQALREDRATPDSVADELL